MIRPATGQETEHAPGDARGAWAFAIALLLFVAGRCLVPMDETDLFYNLRLGEIVLGTRGIPRTNLLSFTYPDYPDPNLAWVFQILLVLAHRAAGIPGTVLLKTTFVVATFALLFRVALRRGAHPILAAIVLALAAWAAEPRFVERPHLMTFLGLATLLLALERAESGSRRLLWALVPLGLLWANGNSCFFLAPSILLLYAAGARLDRLPPGSGAIARRTALVALALIPILFATPSGSGFIGYVANHFRMPSLRPLQEYRTAEWPTDGPFLFLLAAVALVTILPIGRRSHSGNSVMVGMANGTADGTADGAATGTANTGFMRHLLPILALAVLGSRRIRFVAEFALLAGPFVAARGTQILRDTFAPRLRVARVGGWVVLAGLGILTLGPRISAARTGGAVLDLGIEESLVPTAAIRWIDSHGLRDRMYNDLEVGSYLTWDGWPHAPVFQDPRINGYPAELHAILRRRDLVRPEWESLLASFEIKSALITFPDVNPRAALFDPAQWALVYRTGEALVFVRRDQTHAALIGDQELPLTFRFDPVNGIEPMPIDPQPSASPLRPCEWNRRLGDWFVAHGDPHRAGALYRTALGGAPDCLTTANRNVARHQAAMLAIRFGEPERAVELLAGLTAPAARTNRGFALVQLGRSGDALTEFAEVLRQFPDDAEATFGQALTLARLDRRADAIHALRGFLGRWPRHFAAAEARQILNRLATGDDLSRSR